MVWWRGRREVMGDGLGAGGGKWLRLMGAGGV